MKTDIKQDHTNSYNTNTRPNAQSRTAWFFPKHSRREFDTISEGGRRRYKSMQQMRRN